MDGPPPRINTSLLQALVAEGLISRSDSDAASLFARRRGLHVEEAILQVGTLDEAVLLKFQANFYRTQFVSTQKLSRAPISESLLRLIPHKLALKLRVFPVRYDSRNGVLSVLTVQPDDLEVLKNVQFATRVHKVRALVARPAAIDAAIRVHYQDEMQAFGSIRAASAIPLNELRTDAHATTVAGYDNSLSPPGPPSLAPPSPGHVVVPATGNGLGQVGRAATGRPAKESVANVAYGSARPVELAAGTSSAHHGVVQQTGGHEPAVTNGISVGAPAVAAAVSSLPAAAVSVAALPAVGLATGAFAPLPHLVPAAPQVGSQVAMHDYLETLHVLVALLENNRGELRNHSVTVARLCRRFCERLGLTPSESDVIIAAAYLHDIGKNSAFHLTALNVAQYEQHRQQARKSYLSPVRIFESVRLPDRVASILTHLYERVDGMGFPDRLVGKDIDLGSRVIAIVETYVDLTGHGSNPFRRKLTAEEAWDAIAALKGKVFDPNLVEVFKSVVLGDGLRAKLLSGGRRALIADGDAEETTVLELRLMEHGYDVVIARNADEALKEMDGEFDVVISEVDLLPFDGFTLIARARELGVTAPFVFLSKHSESDVVQRGFDLGADEFITKPASSEVVALKVNRVLDGARKRRPAHGISGSLSEMSLPDVVQILFHGRKTGRLSVSSGNRAGDVVFCEGQIFEASFGELAGEEAVYAMLKLTSGGFELDPSCQPGERKIDQSPESLLLEGMRRMDEAER